MRARFPSGPSLQTARLAIDRREAALVTAALAALLVWLPLQTPIAIVAYQYAGVPAGAARAILLLKDLLVGFLLLVLVIRHGREFRWHWFDLAAVAYVALLIAYSVVPQILGDALPLTTVAASFREFLVPVELYALGRFALIAGADTRVLVMTLIVVAGIAAAFTVLLYVLVPVQFWSSTLDLVTFVREVQGRPSANSLVDLSLLGRYRVEGLPEVSRAVGPFTHPVGTGYYFVIPLVIAVAAVLAAFTTRDPRQRLLTLGMLGLFLAAVITPISRGAWLAGGMAALICGLLLRRKLATVLGLAVVSLFLVITPPFSYSISSAVAGQDLSTVGHVQEIERGVETVAENPLGLGVGHGDSVFGATFVEEDELVHLGVAGPSVGENVGENMYLAILASVGPLGLLTFLLWLLGVATSLLWSALSRPRDWVSVALLAVLVGLAVSSVTASPFMRFTTAASFWLLVGLHVPAAQYRLSEVYRRVIIGLGEIAGWGRRMISDRRLGS